MAAETIEIYDPRAEFEPAAEVGALRPVDADGHIGVIDNGKPNFDLLAAEVVERLRDTRGSVETLYRRKPAPSHGAPEAWYEEMAERCSLVLTGSAD